MLARLIAAAFIVALTWAAAPAHAQNGRWWRAESPNFIVYGDRDERQVRAAAQALEDFDATLRTITGITGASAATAETKLEVYLVRGTSGLRQVWPNVAQHVAGFYTSGYEQIAAFVRYDDDVGLSGNTVLFHEYAHHFMLHYFPNAYPRWYVEGFAEYVSTVEFRQRQARVGIPSRDRSGWILHGTMLPIDQLLAPERVRRQRGAFTAMFYAQSWFAALYIANNSERGRGLERYVRALGDGADPIEAFEPAFGITPEAFDRELRAFKRARISVLGVPLPTEFTPIRVSRLTRTEDDLLLPLVRMRTRGYETLSDEDAASLDALGARYPDEPAGRILRARVAMNREDYAAARAHVDAILAADETHAEARYISASLTLQEAREHTDPQRTYTQIQEARRQLARGFRNDPNHYPTLYLYATTFAGGYEPMEDAQLNVLARALELAPQSDGIRLLFARELIKAESYEAAVVTLRPLIYAPHGGENAARARVLFAAAQAREQPSAEAEAEAARLAAEEDDDERR
jgi:hypothetical protein